MFWYIAEMWAGRWVLITQEKRLWEAKAAVAAEERAQMIGQPEKRDAQS